MFILIGLTLSNLSLGTDKVAKARQIAKQLARAAKEGISVNIESSLRSGTPGSANNIPTPKKAA